MNKMKIFPFLLVLALLSGITLAYGSTVGWNHSYDWNKPTVLSIAVFTDSALTVPYVSGGTSSINASQPYTEVFYIKNTGNVDVLVTATAISSGVTVAWIPSDSVEIAVGTHDTLTLTLSNFQVGAGSCTISFGMTAT